MKIITFILALVFSFNVFADCGPQYEEELSRRLGTQRTITKVGAISTGATFVAVGGFWGTMGVIMTGPLWAGAIIGATFGAGAALPVGAGFLIVHQVQKMRIRKIGRMVSVLQGGDELEILHQSLVPKFPQLTLDDVKMVVSQLDESEALCDGSVARFGRFASVRDLRRYFKQQWPGHVAALPLF